MERYGNSRNPGKDWVCNQPFVKDFTDELAVVGRYFIGHGKSQEAGDCLLSRDQLTGQCMRLLGGDPHGHHVDQNCSGDLPSKHLGTCTVLRM